jgi:hypothetical protein
MSISQGLYSWLVALIETNVTLRATVRGASSPRLFSRLAQTRLPVGEQGANGQGRPTGAKHSNRGGWLAAWPKHVRPWESSGFGWN